MDDNLGFEVSKYDLQEISDTEVMKVRMWIVSEGNNRHDKPISWEAIQKAKPSLVGKPIVAEIDRFAKDFKGHEPTEIPIGIILSENDIYEKKDESGKRWLVADGYIWYRYAKNASDIMKRDKIKNLSMEIRVVESGENDSIESFVFTGITLISKTPAIPSARAEVIKFSEVADNIKHMLEDKAFSSAKPEDYVSEEFATSIAEHIVKILKKEDKNMSKEVNIKITETESKNIIDETNKVEEIKTEDVKMSEDVKCAEDVKEDIKEEEMAETEDVKTEDVKAEAKEEKMAEDIKEEANEEKMADETLDNEGKEEMAKDEKKTEDMEEKELVNYEEKFNKLNNKFSEMTEELKVLRTFKSNIEEKETSARVSYAIKEVSDSTDMPEDEVKNWESKVSEFNSTDSWENAFKASAFNYAKKLDTKDNKVAKYAIPDANKSNKKLGIWNRI